MVLRLQVQGMEVVALHHWASCLQRRVSICVSMCWSCDYHVTRSGINGGLSTMRG